MDTGQESAFNLRTVDWRPDEATQAEISAQPTVPQGDISDQDIATFQRDGVVRMPGAFVEWVEPLRRGLGRILSAPESFAFPCESVAPGEPGRFFDSYCNWHRVPEFLDFALNSPAASLAGQVMQASQAQLFHEHVFVKEPGTARATPWHHDLPYYCIAGPQTASVYVALDSTPLEVAVRFVAGSHRWGKLFFPRVFLDGADFNTDDDTLSPVPDIDGEPEAYEIISWPLEPGDALLFDFRTLHGTGASELKTRRRAFSTRWLGDSAHYLLRPGELSPPLTDIGLESGEAMPGHWFPILWQRPH